MAILATLTKYWKIGIIVALFASVGFAYHLWTVNGTLRTELSTSLQRNKVLRDARVKDALAAKKLIEIMQAEQRRLLAQLGQLGGIQDEDGRNYLDATVPDSVSSLFNR